MDPDRLAELEEERRFLLRSLADLEREREAGDVDDDDYVALRDGYTARAATVLRAIDEGRSALPARQPANWRKRIAIIAGVVAFGVLAGVLLAYAVGDRGSGDTITGGNPADQVAQLLAEGRSLFFAGQLGDASAKYLAALEIDKDNVEALTYAGWVLAVSAQGQSEAAQAEVLGRAKQFLDDAIAIDPTYADPHCFLAVIAIQFEDDPATAATRRDECLAANPSTDMVGLVNESGVPASTTTAPATTSAPATTG